MTGVERTVRIGVGDVVLEADWTQPARSPDSALGTVVFAHGSGSSRHSPRNRFVAGELAAAGLATILTDLLTPAEEQLDLRTAELRFDIALLAGRLIGVTDWLRAQWSATGQPIGLFGASTGAAAALVAAAARPDTVAAVVSRGGRPDLAGESLDRVRQPTLLIVGERDPQVLDLNLAARKRLAGPTELTVVPGASHLFEEPGALEQVAQLARDWFVRHLGQPWVGISST
ncbi:MAG TPA: alpha/beta family hydrolase [Actinomycetes bacterium]|jgi:dienelactone hydrolase|nr:alpha/beta family hydrolase [Actinomycetes bacterium]